MARKRSADHDWICMRCGCPCNPSPGPHIGGGQNMKACAGPSDPILRSVYEAEISAVVAGLRQRTGGIRAER